MTISLVRIDPADPADRAALVDFMTGHDFPFHVGGRRTAAQVEAAIADGAYRDEDNDSYWVELADTAGTGAPVDTALRRIGFLRFEDLTDETPVFDLRLATEFRGRGLGVEVLRAATDHVFRTMPHVRRFEGQTRDDNVAMRTVMRRAGWVKEAHYREGWPVPGGEPRASVAYAILRRDWDSGTTTPVPWDDEPA